MSGPLKSTQVLDGYPAGGFGDRYVSCADHIGPASYASVVTGSPPTGGDVVRASEFGLRFITKVIAGISDDGQYRAEAVDTQGGLGEAATLVLAWTVVNTGAQVAATTNLSARRVRLFAIGR